MIVNDLLLIGASGLAREVISASLPSFNIVGILDDNATLHGTTINGLTVLGTIDLAATRTEAILLCVGKGTGRRQIAERLLKLGVANDRYSNVVDSSVRIPASCEIGRGSIVLAGVVLTADVRIGTHVVVMPNVTLTHDDHVEDFVTLAAGVCLGGGVRIGEAAYLGMGSSVREGLEVGREASLGMGAVLTKPLPAGAVWVGNPAAALRRRSV